MVENVAIFQNSFSLPS